MLLALPRVTSHDLEVQIVLDKLVTHATHSIMLNEQNKICPNMNLDCKCLVQFSEVRTSIGNECKHFKLLKSVYGFF